LFEHLGYRAFGHQEFACDLGDAQASLSDFCPQRAHGNVSARKKSLHSFVQRVMRLDR
jgi:hypothetical protein